MNRIALAKELVALAEMLAANETAAKKTDKGEEGAEVEDPMFVKKITELKSGLSGLGSKKSKKLSKFGIGTIKPMSATVEDLVDALRAVVMA